MPVSLDQMMREISPERRADIEKDASNLADAYRQRVGHADPAAQKASSPMRVAVGTKAATGQRCPESGVWKAEGATAVTMPIAIDTVMPPHADRAVTRVLVQYG